MRDNEVANACRLQTDAVVYHCPGPLHDPSNPVHAERIGSRVQRHAPAGSGKIFAIGLSRTGTSSITRALELLGYSVVHFPHDEVSRTEIGNYIRNPTQLLKLSLLDNIDALTDTPVSATYKALDRTYPASRFILTTRDKPAWLDSCQAYWDQVLQPLLKTRDEDVAAYICLINKAVYGIEHFDPVVFSAAYDRHVTSVQQYFKSRPSDFLSIDICCGEGWPKLCEYLQVSQFGEIFPHENKLLRSAYRLAGPDVGEEARVAEQGN
jgi:hypothetical protein